MSAQRVSGIKPSDSSTAWDTAPPHALESIKTAPLCYLLLVWQWTSHTEGSFFHKKTPALWTKDFKFGYISHIYISYVRKWVKPLFWISSGFLSATWPVKAASLLFTVETETCLLRPLLSCVWGCCCESHTGCGLSETSNSVVGLGLPDFLLSVSPSL